MKDKFKFAREIQREVFENEANSVGGTLTLIEDFNEAFSSYKASEVRKLGVDKIAEVAGNFYIWKTSK